MCLLGFKTQKSPQKFLSKSLYGNQRLSLFHLFWMHNRRGYAKELKMELSSLFKSIFRQIMKQHMVSRSNDKENTNNNKKAPTTLVKEGKEPISVGLFKAIAGWLLD